MTISEAEAKFKAAVVRGATRRQLATLEAAVAAAHASLARATARAQRRERLEREAKRESVLAAEQDRRDRQDAAESAVRVSQTPRVEFHVGGRTITISLGHPDITSRLVAIESVKRLAHRITQQFESHVRLNRATAAQSPAQFTPATFAVNITPLLDSDRDLRPGVRAAVIQV